MVDSLQGCHQPATPIGRQGTAKRSVAANLRSLRSLRLGARERKKLKANSTAPAAVPELLAVWIPIPRTPPHAGGLIPARAKPGCRRPRARSPTEVTWAGLQSFTSTHEEYTMTGKPQKPHRKANRHFTNSRRVRVVRSGKLGRR